MYRLSPATFIRWYSQRLGRPPHLSICISLKLLREKLVRAKRIGPGVAMSPKPHAELVGQCDTTLSHSAASFVFAYDPHGLRAGSATKIAGAADRTLYDRCSWTAYRFFLQLFRCPIGDRAIKLFNEPSDVFWRIRECIGIEDLPSPEEIFIDL